MQISTAHLRRIREPYTKNVNLHIWKSRQASGAFEHVVGYDAELELSAGSTSVEVELLSFYGGFPEPSADDTRSALDYIRRAMEAVVLSLGLGGYAGVSNLCIHPVDFVPRMFEQYTKQELQSVIANTV